MFDYISYSDEIILFWDTSNYDTVLYEIYLDDKKIGESVDTFFRIKNLSPDNSYSVLIKEILKNGATSLVYKKTCLTKKQKKDILITASPYKAKGDGVTDNTKIIQKAIDDCNKNHRLVIPEGVFLTGALKLHSDLEILIEKGGVIKGSEKKEDYLPLIKSRFEGWECDCYSSLINIGVLDHSKGASINNVIIRGEGKIVGGGENLLFDILGLDGKNIEEKRDNLFLYQENIKNDKEKKYRLRGRLINISNASNIVIDGLELSNSPSWNVHMIYSDNVVTCGTKFISKGIWNGDGWNPDSSKNCTIFDSEFDTGDDCIAIKSGKNPEGNLINIPTENINIFSCRVKKGRSHGISIGSEVSGGIDGVNIWNSDFSNSFFGIHIKTTKKRGGYVKNVTVNNTKTSRVLIREVPYNDDGKESNSITEISNIKFNNVDIEYNSGDPNFTEEVDSYIYINGFECDKNKVNNISFNNITINNKENIKDYNIKNCFNVMVDGKNIL